MLTSVLVLPHVEEVVLAVVPEEAFVAARATAPAESEEVRQEPCCEKDRRRDGYGKEQWFRERHDEERPHDEGHQQHAMDEALSTTPDDTQRSLEGVGACHAHMVSILGRPRVESESVCPKMCIDRG
jgi:hypothetical protein